MTIKIGINGFGRIGRNFFRAAKTRGADIDFVAANDLLSVELMAHLLKYDSILGTWDADIEVVGDGIKVNGDTLQIMAERDPKALPWSDLGVGHGGRVHRESSPTGTRRPCIWTPAPRWSSCRAPSKGADATFVMGVNDETFDPDQHKVVSNASCTTNCFVPMVKILDDAFGVERGLMTTVHAYTGTQALVDGPSKDLREARAAAINVIPASTGAARATNLVLESMKGRLDGQALRVPVPDGSITDFTAVLGREVWRRRSTTRSGPPRRADRSPGGLVVYSEEPIVSSRHRRFSGFLHLRRPADHGHRKPGQGHGLVRQRVGVLQPPGGSDRADRRPALSPSRLRTMEDLGDLSGRRVLVRCDFNVPMEDGRITDDLRIQAADAHLGGCSSRERAWCCVPTSGGPRDRSSSDLRLGPVAARLR